MNPSISLTLNASSSLPLARLNHALPPRPTVNPPPPSSFLRSAHPRGTRSPPPVPVAWEKVDRYRPPPPHFRDFDDSYVPSRSPPPRRYKSPQPPSKRRRSASPNQRRRSPSSSRSVSSRLDSRSPVNRRLSPSPTRSRSAVQRRPSPSLTRRAPSRLPLVKRRHSPSPTHSERHSLPRDEVEPLPTQTFYTHAHKKEEALERKRQRLEETSERVKWKASRDEAREKARKEKEDQWIEYRKRRAELAKPPL